jgi:uroporphyrinogen-III synthase
MIKVLSTKKLSSKQLETLVNSEIFFKEYNAISIIKKLVRKPVRVENAIITSQNSASILINLNAELHNVFCVGSKTAALLNKNKYNIIKSSNNAVSLANFIVKNYSNDLFVFFCGNKRRDELPAILLQHNISFSEKIIYNTELNIEKQSVLYDAILFFSPSAVTSYLCNNSLDNAIAFCIGETTAKEAQKYALKTVVSEQATIESTIEGLMRYFKA